MEGRKEESLRRNRLVFCLRLLPASLSSLVSCFSYNTPARKIHGGSPSKIFLWQIMQSDHSWLFSCSLLHCNMLLYGTKYKSGDGKGFTERVSLHIKSQACSNTYIATRQRRKLAAKLPCLQNLRSFFQNMSLNCDIYVYRECIEFTLNKKCSQISPSISLKLPKN